MPVLDIVKAHYDALAQRDLNAALDVINEDAISEFSGAEVIPGRRHGRSGIREFFERIRQTVEVKEFKVARSQGQRETARLR